jgi:hypothetical protein
MDTVATAKRAARRVPVIALLGTALVSGSGCRITYDTCRWASQPFARSRAIGVVSEPGGGEQVLFRLEACPDRPDGWYSLDVPVDWQDRPTHASRWGADIRGLAGPDTPLVRVGAGTCAARTGRVAKLDFPEVVRRRRPRPVAGARRPARYGVIYVDHTREACFGSAESGRFSAEVFGYNATRGHWVHLAGVPLDVGRPRRGRMAVATLLSPATILADGIGWVCVIQSCGLAARGFELWDDFHPMYELPERTAIGAGLGPYGMHAKPAVPRLRQMLEDEDRPEPRTRLEAAAALCSLCPLEAPGIVGELLRDPNLSAKYRRAAIGLLSSRRIARAGWRSGSVAERARWLVEDITEAAAIAGVEDEVAEDPELVAGVLHLAEALQDPDAYVRRETAEALGQLGLFACAAVPALLVRASGDEHWRVRSAAVKALNAIPHAR